MELPKLTPREQRLLYALQAMRLWVSHKLEPQIPQNTALKRDLKLASDAIREATGGNEE